MPTPRSARSQCADDGNTVSDHNVEIEKSTPYPMCYGNLLAGRSTGVSTSTSPGQTAQPGKCTLANLYLHEFSRLIFVCFYSCFRR